MNDPRRATVEQVVRVALDASVQRFFAHEAGVRAGGDPEDVHQARVACRRFRSDLRTFCAFLDEEWAEGLRNELKWLGSELGSVRDHEVLLDRLRGHIGRLPEPDRESATGVVARLETDWEAARATMLAAFATPRFRELTQHWRAGANAPRCNDAARQRAVDALRPVVRRPWKKLAAAVDALEPDPPDDALHAVRIRAKRARYAAEAVVSVYGDRARRFGGAMARIQDLLGEHQDAVVARHWLAKAAVDAPADGYVIGMLAQVEWEAAIAARGRFPALWAWARRRELRAWL